MANLKIDGWDLAGDGIYREPVWIGVKAEPVACLEIMAGIHTVTLSFVALAALLKDAGYDLKLSPSLSPEEIEYRRIAADHGFCA
jgi:hypothetical protein